MIQLVLRLSLLIVCAAFFAPAAQAQSARTITIRILDSKTTRPIGVSNFLVRINHQQTIHANWATQNEDHSAKLTVPADATVVSIQATFDSAMQVFVNCDIVQKKQDLPSQWYSVSKILTSGVVAPNGCSKMKETAQPGEFIFFVRRANCRDRSWDDF